MAKVLGIGGVFIKADDPTGLFAWYERLGLPGGCAPMSLLHWRLDDDPAKKGMTVWSLFPRDTKYFGTGPQTVMVNYMVDDLDGMLVALREAGVDVDPKREDSEYGRFAWATDPEGNRIELWQPPA